MPHGKVKLTVIWLLASSGMSRGVDGHWWCVAVLCDCCGVQRAALCCVVWFQVDREAEGFPLTAGRDECGRGGYTLPRTIINNTYSSAWSSFLYTRTVCVHDCMHVEERKTICQGMSAVGCPCVCVCVCMQHLAFWVQGAELWRMSCAYTHSPWNPHRDNRVAYTHTTQKPTHTFIHCCCVWVGCQPHPQVNKLSLKILIWISYQPKNRKPNPDQGIIHRSLMLHTQTH